MAIWLRPPTAAAKDFSFLDRYTARVFSLVYARGSSNALRFQTTCFVGAEEEQAVVFGVPVSLINGSSPTKISSNSPQDPKSDVNINQSDFLASSMTSSLHRVVHLGVAPFFLRTCPQGSVISLR